MGLWHSVRSYRFADGSPGVASAAALALTRPGHKSEAVWRSGAVTLLWVHSSLRLLGSFGSVHTNSGGYGPSDRQGDLFLLERTLYLTDTRDSTKTA